MSRHGKAEVNVALVWSGTNSDTPTRADAMAYLVPCGDQAAVWVPSHGKTVVTGALLWSRNMSHAGADEMAYLVLCGDQAAGHLGRHSGDAAATRKTDLGRKRCNLEPDLNILLPKQMLWAAP